ncbi:DUF1631 family protein [Chitinolyticbacter meiyuanensis]|uniref:DUF1631 family protein n=1 Tax=Chitinolyticbacter meiyuanensis TaxID=682798 RepID=UPI0011E5B96A|nr:DUF1631 family protein [Chitinolyticbacter meiyuanensis]
MQQARNPQPPPRLSATLAACRDMALKLLSDSLDGYFAELEEKFFELAENTHDRELRDVYFGARTEIKAKKLEIIGAFRNQFVDAFNERWSGNKNPASGFFKVVVDTGELSLVANDDYEESLTASRVANALKQKGGDTLSQLEQRLASLMPRDENDAINNPLSPEAICEAFLAACRQLESGLSARLVALQAFETALSDRVASVYQSVNQYLIQQNVQPIATRGVVRRTGPQQPQSQGAGPEAGAAPAMPDAGYGTPQGGYPAGSVAPGMMGGGFAAGGGLGAGYGMPAAGMAGAAGAPYMPSYGLTAELAQHFVRLATGEAESRSNSLRPEWFSFLDNLQHDPPGATNVQGRPENLLTLLRSTRWAGELGRGDTMTFDLVAMLFDRLFEDPNLPNVAKKLLARLQIPVLKVALLDTGFFADKQHPARRFVDLLEEAFADKEGEPAEDDPVLVTFTDAVAWVVDHYEDDLGAFDAALGRIESFYAELEAAAEARTRDAAEDLIQNEVQELANVTAGALVDARLHINPDAPPLVRDFLAVWWKGALAAAYGPEGEAGEEFGRYVRVMDELLWSLRPKTTPEERLQLVNTLPAMLKALEQGARRAGISPDASKEFFSQLVQCHALAIRSGLRAASEPAPQAPSEGTVVAQPVAVQPTPVVQATASAPQPMPASVNPVGIQRGDWVTWESDDNRTVRLRLSWLSPQGTRFLFTNRQGENGLTLTRLELDTHLDSGRLRLVEVEESATDRALNQLREQLGA